MIDNTSKIIKQDDDDVTLKYIIQRFKEIYRYLLSKWLIILIVSICGAGIGLSLAYITKPIYKANLSFALQDEKSGGGGLSGALGLASQFGLDVGGTAGGEFSGDNLLELMRSRSMIEKALLSAVKFKGKTTTLADVYIDFNNLREKWDNNPEFKNVNYPLNADRSKFTLKQDSILGLFYATIIKKNLSVDKVDKKLSIITVRVNSTNEFFSKTFTEVLVKVVSDFYIQTKTEKASKNVAVLQHQTDSVREILNNAIAGVASSIDVNPNPNPLLATLRVPSQRRQIDIQINTAILSELVKNLELAKMSLLQSTPLIQVIDNPILPLEKEKFGRLKGLILGSLLSGILVIVLLTVGKIFKDGIG